MLGRRYWGCGFATEGARAALRHAFSVLNVPHVISLIHPDNALSIRVAQKLGERLEGTVEIAKIKLPDLNTTNLQSAMRTVMGTARNMGIEVEG